MTGSVAGVSGLTLRYGKVTALDNVTLEIPEGRMVGLIGPDGVGKSSLLSLLAGARVIQQGKVEVLGGDMRDVAHRNRVCPRTAYMPQGLGKNLYPTLSVEENLDFFGSLFGHDKAERERRITDLLAATGMTPFRSRPASASGRALAGRSPNMIDTLSKATATGAAAGRPDVRPH